MRTLKGAALWVAGLIVAVWLISTAMDSGHENIGVVLMLLTFIVFAPGFFSLKQRGFDKGLGTKREKDGMRRD